MRWNTQGWRHRELGRLAGVSKRTIDRIAAHSCMPSHSVLMALAGPLGYPHAVVEALHRRSFTELAELDAICERAAPPDAGMTGQQLMERLAALTPEQRALPIRGASNGGWVVDVRVGVGAILVEARFP